MDDEIRMKPPVEQSVDNQRRKAREKSVLYTFLRRSERSGKCSVLSGDWRWFWRS